MRMRGVVHDGCFVDMFSKMLRKTRTCAQHSAPAKLFVRILTRPPSRAKATPWSRQTNSPSAYLHHCWFCKICLMVPLIEPAVGYPWVAQPQIFNLESSFPSVFLLSIFFSVSIFWERGRRTTSGSSPTASILALCILLPAVGIGCQAKPQDGRRA